MTHCRMIGMLLLLLGVSLAGQAVAQAPVLSVEGAKKAADNYQRYCALCHGKDREGHVTTMRLRCVPDRCWNPNSSPCGKRLSMAARALPWVAISMKWAVR